MAYQVIVWPLVWVSVVSSSLPESTLETIRIYNTIINKYTSSGIVEPYARYKLTARTEEKKGRHL